MQAAERSQLRRLLSLEDFNLHRGVAMSITVSISAIHSHTPDVDSDEMSNSRYLRRVDRWSTVARYGIDRWYRSLWASTSLAVESPTDLFVASHWLERSSCRFIAFLFVFSRADHSTLQVLTTFHVVFITTFTEGLLQKPPSTSDLRWLIPRPWRHTPRLLVMHVVFRFLLKIFEYAAKQACKQRQCNKDKLLVINGLHNQKGLGYSQHTNYTHQMRI